MVRMISVAFFALVIAALSTGPVRAASDTGVIAGKVLDSAGRPLAGVRIGIIGPKSMQITSSADGSYKAEVPAGFYTILISAAGYESSRQNDIPVFAGESVAVNTTLVTATLTTIATVSVGSSTSVSDSSSSSSRLAATTMRDQGQDQIVNILDQAPGVEVNRVGGGSNEPGANTSISVRGAQPYESQVLIDGHPVDTIGNGAFGFNATFTNAVLLSGIETSKGPGSMPNTIVDAVGGSVNLQTAPITPKFSGELMSQYDNFGGWTYGMRVSDTIGKWGFLAAVARETTPGYMAPQSIFGFGRASFFSPYTSPTYPLTGNNQLYAPGTQYVGVLNYAYPATSDFQNDGQLFKLAYNFSRVTTFQLSSYSTQTWLDETGNNVGNIYATIAPCITNGLGPGILTAAPTCSAAAGTAASYDENFTATPYLGYVGKTVPINLYAGYPNTYEIDKEPIITADLRTVIGQSTLLARFYAGSITRDVVQDTATGAIGPCYSPSCPWVGSDPVLSGNAGANFAADNGYAGEPYYELTTDILHGFDAQWSMPLGGDRGAVTFGFDTHNDSFNYTEAYSDGWFWGGSGTPADPYFGCGYPTQTAAQIFSCAYTISYHPQPHIAVRSTTESLRGDYQLGRHLDFEFGGYLSNTTYVGSRFDPRAGLTWRPTSKLSLRGSAGSAYVTPYAGLIQTAGSVAHKTFTPATGIFKAETSMGYDIGADYAYARNSLLSADLYSTTMFNRYALYQCVSASCKGTFNGKPYTSEILPNSQGQTANRGLELSIVHQPAYGFGYDAKMDLLRDYSYGQSLVTSGGSLFLGPLPADGVQIPGYQYDKMRADIWYKRRDGETLRFGSTTYGANNSFGQPGFTVYDASFVAPVHEAKITIGVTNLFNKDNGATGGLYFGGYTYPALPGSVDANNNPVTAGPTNWQYATPQTFYVQISTSLGH